MRRSLCLVVAALTAWAALGQPGIRGWRPPPEGAVSMFRQIERVFAPGAETGGAGHRPGTALPSPVTEPTGDRTLTYQLASLSAWDAAEGPAGRVVSEGRVLLYRDGAYVPEIVARPNQPVALPPGRWHAVGEAPGQVTAFDIPVQVSPFEQGGGSLLLPLVPACEVQLSAAAAGSAVDRVDLVSVEEGAVIPLVPGQRETAMAPAGRLLAYSVVDRKIQGVVALLGCREGEHLEVAPPAAPAAGRRALLLRLAPAARLAGRSEPGLVACCVDDATEEAWPADFWVRQPDAIWAVFLDLPNRSLELRLELGEGESVSLDLPPADRPVEEVSFEIS